MEWIILGVLAAIAVWGVSLYNRLVKLKQMVEEGWSGISVQLKRRADLIPNLLETVKGYASHEKDLFEKVTELRAKAQKCRRRTPGGKRAKVEGLLGRALANVIAVAENYPDLKADANFREFQNSLSEIEDEIQMSRRYYNGTVRNNNTLVQQFPSNLIANFFSFGTAEYFEIEDPADRAVPDVSF